MPVALQKADFASLKSSTTEETDLSNINGGGVSEDVEDGEIEDGTTAAQEHDIPTVLPRRLSVADSEASSRPSSPPLPTAHAAELPPPPPSAAETDTVTELSSSPTLVRQPSLPLTSRESSLGTSRSESPPPGLVQQPFLIMSPENLEQAKTLVLDLLGWGVPPEYLVECGVSPQSIYKIFADLNLQLPDNFQVHDADSYYSVENKLLHT